MLVTRYLAFCFAIAASLSLSLSAHASNNILLIIADDMGIDASAVYNLTGTVAPTTNIASLAANGIKFTNAYAYPLCSPTRSAMLTGRQGFRTGTANVAGGASSNNALKATEFTLPDAFAANSGLQYQLKHVGKWHLGATNTSPTLIGGWPSFDGAMVGEVADYYAWTKVSAVGATASSTTSTTYATTDNVNDAVSFISTQTGAAKPWFLWLAFNAPHIPYHKPPTSLLTTAGSIALSGTTTDINANPRNYFNAMIEAMDTEIGRLLQSVNLATTDIIFVGDNGTEQNVLQSPYPANRGKATLYEGGIRVPLIIRGPDVVSPGRTSSQLVHLCDLYSTILELAGINVATTTTGITLDAKSLMPVIQNNAGTRTQVFDEYWDLAFPTQANTGRSLRDGQYKLIRLATGTDLFYDLNADPYEAANLVGSMNATQTTAYNNLVTAFGNYNTAPTISGITNRAVAQGASTGAIAFTVGDGELNPAILSVTGVSSNTALLPNANIVLGGSGTSRTVTVTPASGQNGTATITLTVNDGVFTTNSSFVLTVGASTSVSAATVTPSSPTNTDTATITATVAPGGGATLSSVNLQYSTGGQTTNTVWTETMSATQVTPWVGVGSNVGNPWITAPASSNDFKATLASNHGSGNAYGLELSKGTANAAQRMFTITNGIDTRGTSGYIEFWISTTALVTGGNNGWVFQTSSDGTNWTTRLSELTSSIHGFQQYHYDFAATELVSALKFRFQFVGNATAAPPPKVLFDDMQIVVTTGAAPQTIAMFDDGLHGDGAAGDGVYGATIPAQATSTNVSYTITATDSLSGTATASGSYTVAAAAPVLAVTPATTLSSSGAVGSGSYSPSSVTYTLSNTGAGTMNWTAAKTAAWLDLSATSGSLAAGATTTVTASINTTNANSLAAATYNDTITFTNAYNGTGNTTRAASLLITNGVPTAPATPTITAVTPYSAGTSKWILWPSLATATSYTIQIATDAGFTQNVVAQTVTTPYATFANLTHGVTYYYRVLATNNVGSSSYSAVVSSTQDAVAPTVAITSPASGGTQSATTITVSGTASDALSGISAVKVNNVSATVTGNTWTATIPLGFGTNAITATAFDGAGNTKSSSAITVLMTTAQTYNPLIIPDIITGTQFDLEVSQTSKKFPALPDSTTTLGTNATTTLGYNGALMWGPTLIMNKGDYVQLNVKNSLDQSTSPLLRTTTTTVHWHGLHIPAIMDGGPRQVIPGGTTWSPSWTVLNDAATFWYHPHLHVATQEQLTLGAGGFLIVRDPQEASLGLPRTYGVDDIPLALTSRRYLRASNQFSFNQYAENSGTTSSLDNYGDTILINGTHLPQVSLPKQFVRLRILNGEIQRGYNLGFSDNRTYYVIANDQGLLNAPVAVTRMFLMVGERVEVLVDMRNDTAAFDLKAYNTGQVFGFPSQEGPVGGSAPTGNAGPENGSRINNSDFNLLHINPVAATSGAITTLPATLANNTYWTAANVTNTRTISVTGGQPSTVNGITTTTGFSVNNVSYSPSVMNHTIPLNAIERWNITAGNVFGHSLHIHDIKFKIIERYIGSPGTVGAQVTTNGQAAGYESGWKDTVYIPRGEGVSVVAKYDDFASNVNPYMFHCHFMNHEDGGMMGQFLVVNNAVEDLAVASFTRYGSSNQIDLDFKATPGTTYTLQYSADMSTWTTIGSVTSDGNSAGFTETDGTRLGQAKGFYRVVLPTTSAAPAITSATTATGSVGSAFNYQITATNSPTSYIAVGLPAGLSYNSTTGLISGTPTTAATSNVTFTATNAGGTGEGHVVLTVN